MAARRKAIAAAAVTAIPLTAPGRAAATTPEARATVRVSGAAVTVVRVLQAATRVPPAGAARVSVLAAAKASGLTSITINGTGSTTTATCNTSGSAWAAEAPLKAAEGTAVMWCVDSTGKSVGEAASIGATYACS